MPKITWSKKKDGSYVFKNWQGVVSHFKDADTMADYFKWLVEYQDNQRKYVDKLESTLRVIQTWATFDNGNPLVPEHVAELVKKTLGK